MSQHKPYVAPDVQMKELTVRAVLLGVILAIVLGAANAYLGLVAGMTVAATFPAAVISMAVLRVFRGTVLEENIARTTGAVGEALAAGAIFTLPAFLIANVWEDFHVGESMAVMLVGGILGVLFVILLRRTMCEDATLPYPESKACSEIVKAGQEGGGGASYVVWAAVFAAVVEFFKNPNGIPMIKPYVKHYFSAASSKVQFIFDPRHVADTSANPKADYAGGALVESPASSPALVGVGYIIGPKYAAITFSGGVFGWLFLMPLMLFLDGKLERFADSGQSWVDVASAAYNAEVKPIAVGAMLVGAFYTLYKMRTNLIAGIRRGIRDMASAKESGAVADRTQRDIPMKWVLIGLAILMVPMVAVYYGFTDGIGAAIVAAFVMAFAGLLFAAVAGYLVGIIGSSSNPISGLTLTTLLIAALMMVLLGVKGPSGVAATLGVAAVVCCVAGVAGDMMQDWKVGYILGGTPWRMQIGGMIGVIAAALTLVFPLMWLHQGYPGGIGGEHLPAPQAGLMAMMAQGIVGGEMAWSLVVAGVLFAVALILIGSPSPMLIAVGMYLPFHSTAAIFTGGVIAYLAGRVGARRNPSQKRKELLENTGILIASGLVAGEALTGIFTAAIAGLNLNLPEGLNSPWLGIAVFAALAFILIYYPVRAMARGPVGDETPDEG